MSFNATSFCKIIKLWVVVMFVRFAISSKIMSITANYKELSFEWIYKNLTLNFSYKIVLAIFSEGLKTNSTGWQGCSSWSCCRRCWPTVIIANRWTPADDPWAILRGLIFTNRSYTLRYKRMFKDGFWMNWSIYLYSLSHKN